MSGPPSLQLGVSSEFRSLARAFSAPREFELQLPEADATAVAHWAAVAAPSFDAWYVLRMRLSGGSATHTLTMLLTHDYDVLDSIASLVPVAIDSLVCLMPPSDEDPASLRVVQISEIWADTRAHGRKPVFIESTSAPDRPRVPHRTDDLFGLELFARVGAQGS